MKQTSAALTFLMAQYRAIFKRAYIKGIAAAVLMTAGLAAGQAQAAGDQSSAFASGGEAGWNTPTNVVNLASGDTVTASGDIFTNTLTATDAVTVTTSGAGRVIVKDSMTLNNATLTLSGTTNGAGIFGFTTYPVSTEAGAGQPLFNNRDKVTNFSATNTAINITGTQQAIIFNNMTINNSASVTSTIASGSGIGADNGDVEGANRGVLTINGGTYNLGDGSWMYASQEVNIGAGTIINASGSGDAQTSFSDIYAYSTGVMNFEGTLNVASGDGAKLRGGVLNLTDTSVINNSGTLILGSSAEGSVINIDGAKITNAGNGYIWAQADVVMTDGSINLQSGQGIAGLRPAADSFDFASGTGVADFTATGGTITLADADIAMLDVTLGGDVEVTLTGADNVAWQENSHIDAVVEGTEGGVFTIQDNASITMNNGSVLTAENFNLNGGTITMQASGDGSAAETSGSAAIIRAFGDSYYVNLNGGAINVVASKAGVIRGENINLAGTSINNQGTLTFAGYITNANNTQVNTVTAPATFQMTGGTLSNATGANLYFGVNGVDNKKSTFTIAGGTFTNAGTVNVASGSTLALTGTSTATPTITNSNKIAVASGASFTTAGTVTVGGTGTIELANGASGTFAGENVILNGILDVQSGANASVTGKVTFNGDGQSGDGKLVDLKIANKDNFKLETGGSLTLLERHWLCWLQLRLGWYLIPRYGRCY